MEARRIIWQGILLLFWALLPAGAQGIKAGPWVTQSGTNSLTILWTSEIPGTGLVELDGGKVIYDTYQGRRIFRRLHRVTVDGLREGETIRYRVGGKNIKDDSNPKDPEFGDDYAGGWHSVRTLDPKAQSCRFSVFNDIHMRTSEYAALASQVDSSATDFIFLNGDIVSAGNYVLDSLVHYAVEPLGDLPAGIPLMFTRGNHEGRGNNTPLVEEVFPHEDPAPFYYAFRQGPVAFIVFDAGETHSKRSVDYSGTPVFEEYLSAQIEWARKTLKEKWFRRAPVKVCLLHVPMIDPEEPRGFKIQRWLNHHFVPMLNKAGIDIMISADLHEFMYCERGTMGNDFPILVNDDARRLEFEYTRSGGIGIRTFNSDGVEEFRRTIR